VTCSTICSGGVRPSKGLFDRTPKDELGSAGCWKGGLRYAGCVFSGEHFCASAKGKTTGSLPVRCQTV